MTHPMGNGDVANGDIATADIRLFESGILADATVVCGERTWKVHKIIVASQSKWFRGAFYGKLAEAASGTVDIKEQDPDLIDTLLRFIYAKDIDIPKLKGGRSTPAFCVQLFRVGDFFQVEDLKKKATAELQSHLDTKLEFPGPPSTVDGQSPQWLTELFDALEEAYRDMSTEPILEILLTFIRDKRHTIFQFKYTFEVLDNFPQMAVGVLKSYLAADAALEPRKPNFRLGLPVHAAINSDDGIYHPSASAPGPGGSLSPPYLLYPLVGHQSSVFTVVDPVTERQIPSLQWMVPRADRVTKITSHETSDVVRVDVETSRFGAMVLRTDGQAPRDTPQASQTSKQWLYIRFDDSQDAKLFVDRYRRTHPGIESVTPTTKAALTAAMQVRLAAVPSYKQTMMAKPALLGRAPWE